MATIYTMPSASSSNGLGIVDFLKGKNYFITGSTGFLGKVLIEKMLRAVPEVGKFFLLIKGKDKGVALQRLETEILDIELFKCLRETYGKYYKAFMLSKLIPVAGNINEFNLGMDAHTYSEISREVDVIVSSAANTSFDDRYDVILNTNTQGPTRLLDFAKKCPRLKLFLHYSTTFVSGARHGKIMEKPFCMKKSIEGEKISSEDSNAAFVFSLDIDDEIKLASNELKSLGNNEKGAQRMKELGIERAKIHGCRNNYEMAKAMGEMVLFEGKTELNVPIVIVRPSIIGSTYAEPFQGWIQGYRMLDPIILSYGQGRLPGFIGDPNAIMDFIPADMVVNATIAAMAKHGIEAKSGLHVYHTASSIENPVSLQSCLGFGRDHFISGSKKKANSLEPMKYFDSIDRFSNYIRKEIVQQSGILGDDISSLDLNSLLQMKMEFNKKMKRFMRMANVYEPYAFHKGRYDISNTKKLMEDMSTEEMKMFGFDVRIVDWRHYFKDIHIPGLLMHVIKKPSKSSILISKI